MTYGYNYYGHSVPQCVTARVRQLEVEAKQADDRLWDIAIANLTSRLESINEHQA